MGWSSARRARGALAMIVGLGASALSCGGDKPTGNQSNLASHFDVVSGDNQQATVNTELANPIVVKATDANGNVVSGAVVNFVVTAGGGSVFAPSTQTNMQGMTQNRWTLGTTSGMQTIEVRAIDANGAPVTYATFHATANAGAATALSKSAGDAQVGAAGAALPTALAVLLKDQFDNVVPNATVTWAAASGSVAPASSTSNASGIAATVLALGPNAGAANTATATVGTSSVTFTATARTGSAVVIVSGSGQTGGAGAALPNPVVVRVNDATGNPVPGASVTWTAASGSGSLAPATSVTNASGQAQATWTLGSIGANGATASIAGGASVSLSATANAAAGTTMTIVNGNNTSAAAASTGPIMIVQVADGASNPLSGVTVAWTVASTPTTSGVATQLTAGTSTTGANGQATMTFVSVGQKVGTVTITASAPGINSVNFATTVTALPQIADFIAGSDFPPSAPISSTVQFYVTFLDRYGNPIPGSAAGWATQPGPYTEWDDFVTRQCGSVSSLPADANGISLTSWTTCEAPGRQSAYFNSVATGSLTKPQMDLVTTAAPTRLLLVHTENRATPGRVAFWVAVTDGMGRVVTATPVSVAVTSGNAHIVCNTIPGNGSCSTTDQLYGQVSFDLVVDGPGAIVVTVSEAGYPDLVIDY
ncbi:MAG: Ig-like domain-containing protein [Gemmatimonadaceae bacterium]